MHKLWITALALLLTPQISPMHNNGPRFGAWEEFGLKNPKAKALISAAGIGDIEQVQTLIQEGVDVNTQDTNDCTALYGAALNGHEELCKLLIKEGAITTSGNNRRPIWKIIITINSPLFIRNFNIAKLLLNPHNLPTKKACSRAIITFLYCVKQKKNENDINLLLSNYWQTLLKPHFACIMRRASHDINEKDKDGDTALMLAARRADASACEWLIQHGADVNIKHIEPHVTHTALSMARAQQFHAAAMIESYLAAAKHYDKATDVCGLLLAHGAVEKEEN